MMIVDGVSGPLFWIDDVHVTGSVAGARVPRWDWVNSFLTTHAQYSEAVLRGGFYTPELVVAGDLSSAEIRRVWSKARRCGQQRCHDLVYGDPSTWDSVRPSLVTPSKQEL